MMAAGKQHSMSGAAVCGAGFFAPSSAFALILIAGIALAVSVFSVLPLLARVMAAIPAAVIISVIATSIYKTPNSSTSR